jgi:hypothetical protein
VDVFQVKKLEEGRVVCTRFSQDANYYRNSALNTLQLINFFVLSADLTVAERFLLLNAIYYFFQPVWTVGK